MKLFPDHSLRDVWFFFDEVQAAQGWEQFVNRINETISKKIFFTGSNASVLHTKVKSVLRGRSIPVEILPLSCREYCDFIGTKPALYGTGKSKTIAAFHSYLEKGGYPEIATITSPVLQITILQEYYSAMLLRDIIEYNHFLITVTCVVFFG